MIDRWKEAFERIVNRMKNGFESGNGVRGDLMKKAVEIFEKLKNLKVEISDKIKSIFEDMKKKMGRNGPKLNDVRLSNFFGQLERLKELINEELDYEKLIEKVQELFGRGSEVSFFKQFY
ncbi:uncharacterized protein LOC129981189 [Argiope bruennichi]|uniref:uncharacterized protein LOC129981189 n=1 Tax=Argiope bruennichi TaxID=94029 RepID=UPI0024951ADA|nr:uncharacterized protein LOC129981189 [Argiope bruennichi]